MDAKGKELVQTLATKYTEALKAVDEQIAAEKEKNKGLVAKAIDAVGGVIKTILQLKDMLMGVLAKAAQAVAAIIKDPIGFLGNLVSAVGAGLNAFIANIAEHLKKGLVGWLLGSMASAGLELPAKFDLRGIIGVIASLLGLTWGALRGRIVQRGVPEKVMGAVEASVPVAQKLQAEGVAGVTEEIKEQVGDLKKNLFSKISEYLVPTVLVAGITWIISLLNPASAFIKACKAIIDFVGFIINQGAQIIEFVNAVLDAIIAIARGGAGGVPQLIEKALAKSVPVLIGALAAILGIGGIANKVKSFFQTLAKPVGKAINWIVDKIVTVGKKLWTKLKAAGKKVRDKVAGKERTPGKDGKADEGDSKTPLAALRDANALVREDSTVPGLRNQLEPVRSRHNVKVLELVVDKADSSSTTIHFRAVNSPEKVSKPKELKKFELCTGIKIKIDAALKDPTDPEVRKLLETLRKDCDALEARVNAGELGDQSQQLAARQDLGDRLQVILDNAGMLGLLDAAPDWSSLSIRVGEARIVSLANLESHGLPDGAKLLYVVRNAATRKILKVGQTTAGSAVRERLTRYERAAGRLSMTVEVEVRIAHVGDDTIEGHEQDLRNQVDWGGRESLPWDNVPNPGIGPRLGRPGPGTPFEPLPGGHRLREEGWKWNEQGRLVPPDGGEAPTFRRSNSPPPEDSVREHISGANGDVEAAAKQAGVAARTFYEWLKRYGLNAKDFR